MVGRGAAVQHGDGAVWWGTRGSGYGDMVRTLVVPRGTAPGSHTGPYSGPYSGLYSGLDPLPGLTP